MTFIGLKVGGGSGSAFRIRFRAITSSLAVLLAVIAFELVRYLGLAMLGLLTLLICANVELAKDGPLGGINNPELHAWDAAHRDSWTRADRAEHRSERARCCARSFSCD